MLPLSYLFRWGFINFSGEFALSKVSFRLAGNMFGKLLKLGDCRDQEEYVRDWHIRLQKRRRLQCRRSQMVFGLSEGRLRNERDRKNVQYVPKASTAEPKKRETMMVNAQKGEEGVLLTTHMKDKVAAR